MPREQGESEEFVETLAPEDLLDMFDAVDGPVILPADVADHFGVTPETARRKLRQLSDRGVLNRRKVSRRVIYWRADGDGFDAAGLQGDASTTLADDTAGHAGESGGDDLTTPGVTVDRMLADTDAEDTATPADAADATETTAKETNAESAPTRTESNVVNHDEWHDQIAEEVAGSGDLADRRADAILAMYDHLRKEGTAEKDELLAVVDPDIVEYADRSSVWSNMVKGQDTLQALPDVKEPASGRNKPWRWDP